MHTSRARNVNATKRPKSRRVDALGVRSAKSLKATRWDALPRPEPVRPCRARAKKGGPGAEEREGAPDPWQRPVTEAKRQGGGAERPPERVADVEGGLVQRRGEVPCVSKVSGKVGATAGRSGPRRMLPYFLRDLGSTLCRARNRRQVILEHAQLLADGAVLLDGNPGGNREVDIAQLAHPAQKLALQHVEILCDGFEGERSLRSQGSLDL